MSDYSASSLIELSLAFQHKESQQGGRITFPSSPSASNSSYGYESLFEATARCPWKTPTASNASHVAGSPIEERAENGRTNTHLGMTTPEVVSLTSEVNDGGQSAAQPRFPVKHFSTRYRQKRRAATPSDNDSDTDMYEPPQRAPACQGSVGPPLAQPPPPLSSYNLFRMDPRVWYYALSELGQLKSRNWIGASSIDAWLLDLWHNVYRKPRFRYLPMIFIQPGQHAPPRNRGTETEAERQERLKEIRKFRNLFDDLPQSAEVSCDLEDCICILNTGGNHYCAVIFTPGTKRIHILGWRFSVEEKIKAAKTWSDWGGPTIWARVCMLYGWAPTQFLGLSVNSVDWLQNGYDCGPIACQVVESVWIRGLPLDGDGIWKRPDLPCCHPLRLSMAAKVHQLATNGHASFLATKWTFYREQIQEYMEGDLDSFIAFEDEIKEQLSQHPRYALIPVEADLRKAMSACSSCKRRLPTGLGVSTPPKATAQGPPGSSTGPEEALATARRLLFGTTQKNDFVGNIEEGQDFVSLEDLGGVNPLEQEDDDSSGSP